MTNITKEKRKIAKPKQDKTKANRRSEHLLKSGNVDFNIALMQMS